MLIGVAAWRACVVRMPLAYRPWLWAICIVGGAVGAINFDVPSAIRAMHSSEPFVFAYVAALLLWRSSARPGRCLAPIAALGRVALSNYLADSAICSVFFYEYGFGLFGVSVYLGQAAFSGWWLKRFRFGPSEWLWRSMTYWRWQPMRYL